MKGLFDKYRSVVRFVVLFLGTYLLLSLAYAGYLSLSKHGSHPPDFITNLVAKQSSAVIQGFGYEAEVVAHESRPTMKLFVNGRYLAQIIEGCNAISITILFIAFVLAFGRKWRKTLIYLLAGSVLIYAVNILRIAVLAMSLYHYPQHKEVLHGAVFPGIIYGMVFLLWVIWVRSVTPRPVSDE